MTVSRSHIQIRGVDDVALITIDDGKLNAFSQATIDDLRSSIVAATKDFKAMVIAGRPGSLSAGLDLNVIRGGTQQEREELISSGADLFRWMLTVPVPVVTACTGHAIAAGAMLLMSSDYRVGTPGGFRFGLTEVAVGVTISEFAMRLARARLATERVLRTTVLAEVVGPDEALRVGFLDQLADGDPVEVALTHARQLANLPARAFAETKALLYQGIAAAKLGS